MVRASPAGEPGPLSAAGVLLARQAPADQLEPVGGQSAAARRREHHHAELVLPPEAGRFGRPEIVPADEEAVALAHAGDRHAATACSRSGTPHSRNWASTSSTE